MAPGGRAALRSRTGFSLVELIIVVAVITVLSTLALSTYLYFRKKALSTEARSGLYSLRKRQAAYFASHETYSSDLNELGFEMFGTGRYVYAVLGAGPNGFSASATANLDGDPDLDVWTIDHDGRLVHLSID